jgi:hypothetical protein
MDVERTSMKKLDPLRALQIEIRRHDFSTFLTEKPSMANGGPGVVVPGCPACKKRLQTMAQFMDHLADDVLPAALDKLALAESRPTEENPLNEHTDIL